MLVSRFQHITQLRIRQQTPNQARVSTVGFKQLCTHPGQMVHGYLQSGLPFAAKLLDEGLKEFRGILWNLGVFGGAKEHSGGECSPRCVSVWICCHNPQHTKRLLETAEIERIRA